MILALATTAASARDFYDENGGYYGPEDFKDFSGAYYTGDYTSPFKTCLGKTDEEIQEKLIVVKNIYLIINIVNIEEETISGQMHIDESDDDLSSFIKVAGIYQNTIYVEKLTEEGYKLKGYETPSGKSVFENAQHVPSSKYAFPPGLTSIYTLVYFP